MINQTIRVGFVGAGANTRKHHIPKLRAQPGVELVAVANRTKESSERVAREFGIPRVYDDWRNLVRAPDVDAVCIGTWPYVHCAITLAALDAGKHVLCEARMAMDAAEARRMLDGARRAPHLITQLVPAPNTLEVDAALQALFADGSDDRLAPLRQDPDHHEDDGAHQQREAGEHDGRRHRAHGRIPERSAVIGGRRRDDAETREELDHALAAV